MVLSNRHTAMTRPAGYIELPDINIHHDSCGFLERAPHFRLVELEILCRMWYLYQTLTPKITKTENTPNPYNEQPHDKKHKIRRKTEQQS